MVENSLQSEAGIRTESERNGKVTFYCEKRATPFMHISSFLFPEKVGREAEKV